jgi:hypothetical protein
VDVDAVAPAGSPLNQALDKIRQHSVMTRKGGMGGDRSIGISLLSMER